MGKKQMAFIHEMDEKNHAYICKNINSIKKEFKDVEILESERIKWEEYPNTCIYNTCRRVFLKSVDSW